MTIKEIKNLLIELNISDFGISFSSDDVLRAETTLCLWKTQKGKFILFTKDRTDYYDIGSYDSEDEACKQFLKCMQHENPAINKYLN